MAITRGLHVRVRPPKVIVVTSSHTPLEKFLKAIEFLSMVRGGVYARFLHANMRDEGTFNSFRKEAKEIHPEIVIAASEKETNLLQLIFEESRPKIVTIPENFFTNFSEHATGGLLPWYRVVNEEHDKHPNLNRDNLFLLKVNASDEFAPFVAASYGVLDDRVVEYVHHTLQAHVHEVSVTTPEELYALHIFMRRHVSWLQFLNQGLKLIHSAFYPPTVVVVAQETPLQDIGLLWNLRDHIAPRGRDESLLLLREQDAGNKLVLNTLAETLLMSEVNSNFCHLKTTSCSKGVINDIARRLRPRLRKLKGKTHHVDGKIVISAPWVPCCETDTQVTVSCDGPIVSIPKIELGYPTRSIFGSWYIDLKKEIRTGRYPFEYAIPKDVDILDLLNTAADFYSPQRAVSFGNECISVSFTASEESSATRFQLPSEREIFEVVLDRAGCEMLLDEKNTRYSSFLDMIDSLHIAALVLCGRSWEIIRTLLKAPLRSDELLGKAKLGKWVQPHTLPEMAELVFRQYSGKLRAIAERRILGSLDLALTPDSTPATILRFLVDHRVVHKRWVIDDCPGCMKRFWLSVLDVSTPLRCPGCTSIVLLQDSVRIGYELNSLVGLAINEGLRTVVLTARFLKNLTSNGFLFYPGAKVKTDNYKTDLDLLAIADETLIVGECKTFSEGEKSVKSSTWDSILDKLQTPLDIAKKAGFHIFFISSLVDEYPKYFQDQMKKLAGESLILLFLTRKDLETGIRKFVDADGHERRLCMHSVLHPESLKTKVQNKKKLIRTMAF